MPVPTVATTHWWTVGRHGVAINFLPLLVNNDGTFTNPAQTTQSILTLWDELDVDMETETEEISSADAYQQHFVVLKNAVRIRAQTVVRSRITNAAPFGGPTLNPLAALFIAYDFYEVAIAFGSPAQAETWQVICTRGRFSRQYRKGRTIEVISLEPVDTGVPNPYYTQQRNLTS